MRPHPSLASSQSRQETGRQTSFFRITLSIIVLQTQYTIAVLFCRMKRPLRASSPFQAQRGVAGGLLFQMNFPAGTVFV